MTNVRRLFSLLALCALVPSWASAQVSMTMPPSNLCAGESPVTTIPAGATQTITSGTYGCLDVYGTLNLGGTVTVKTLHSHAGSTVRMTSGRLLTADLPPGDADQFRTGLIFEGRVEFEGAPKLPWTRLTAEVLPATTQLHLASDPVGWAVGDRVYVPDTRDLYSGAYLADLAAGQVGPEVRTITGISGRVITVNAPFTREHPGARNAGGALERFPAIANLTRSIVIASANPQGTRGHLMITGHATGYIRNVAIEDFGRTTGERLNPVSNHIGRYAAHLHYMHMTGFEFSGNVIDRFTLWGVTVHHSNGHLIRDNVVTRGVGAGFMTEDGTETDNRFERNFCSEIDGDGGRGDGGANFDPPEWGRNGSCYWFQGPHNHVVGNVANRGAMYGFTWWMGGPLKEVADNEAMGGHTALALWYITNGEAAIAPSYVDGFKAWHHYVGSYSYPTRNVVFRDYWARNDPRTQSGGYWSIGLNWGDYETREQVLLRPDIQNMRVAVHLPYGVSGGLPDGQERVTVIDGGRFDGNLVNIYAHAMSGAYPPEWVPPFTAIIRNSTHGTVRSGGVLIHKGFQPGSNANVIARYRVIVESHNGVSGDTFEVYATEQAPDFVIPEDVYSAGRAGLTNATAWTQFQTAVFGAVAPCSTLRHGITGFTCAVGSVPNLPSVPVPDTCTPRSSAVDAEGNMWTFDAQKVTLRNGHSYSGYTGHAYVVHQGHVYALISGGWWGVPSGGVWNITALPCTPPPSGDTTVRYQDGYIIDTQGRAITVDGPPSFQPSFPDRVYGTPTLEGERFGGAINAQQTAAHPWMLRWCSQTLFLHVANTDTPQISSFARWVPESNTWLPADTQCGASPPLPPTNLRLVGWLRSLEKVFSDRWSSARAPWALMPGR